MNIRIIKEKCVGCGNCENICNQKAVSLFVDEKGFLYPKIDFGKCNNCSLCLAKCPVLQKDNCSPTFFQNKVFSAWANDKRVIQNSASGGMFYLIAEKVLRDKGFVCGAVYCEKFHSVKHIISNEENEVRRMQGSKYSQSRLGDIFYKVKTLLETGKIVLFSGTPCEIDACNIYLGKDYPNFYSIALICHGPIAPSILDAYISNKEKEYDSPVCFYSMRYKNKGKAFPIFYQLKFQNGEYEKGKFYDSIYGCIFASNLAMRDACYNCMYKREPYIGDMILGDFKGIEYTKLKENRAGTSVVIVNSEKGKYLWDSIKVFTSYEESDLELVKALNHRLCCSVKKPDELLIKKFWEMFARSGLEAAAKSITKRIPIYRKLFILLKREILIVKKHFGLINH